MDSGGGGRAKEVGGGGGVYERCVGDICDCGC